MTYPELIAIINQYMLLKDHSVVKFMLAVIAANKIEELDPTWAFLVTSSSGGKSTLLEALSEIPSIKYLDDASGATFFSGMKRHDKETSLINKIPRMGMLILTDFTLMLDKDEETNKKIMSQLRLIYDQKFSRSWGTGDDVEWKGRFGLIAGTTTAIYERQQNFAALGERMVYYYIEQPDRIEVTNMALNSIKTKKSGREHMKRAFKEFWQGLVIPEELADIPPELQNYLVELSEMATKARSAVSRKKYHRDNPITNIHALEMPMRMALQLLNIAYGMAIVNGNNKLLPEDYNILYKTAIDSIPDQRRLVMETMTGFLSTDISGVAARLGLPYDTVKGTMEELAALGVVTATKSQAQGRFYYNLDEKYRQLISKFRHIEMTDKVLEKNTDEDEAPMPVDIMI